MKLAVENNTVVSSIKNESQAMMKASGKAFEILSGSLYQHKAAAIVRELSCNAYDSHVSAGKADVPFKVILPSLVHPYFEIEDYGVGLDDYETRNVYLTLFESTKTDTNSNVGAFGLGAKTPISYAGTFTIRTRKNGVERLYTCYKGPDGIPLINLLSESETLECSGVKVTVPVKASDFNIFSYDAEFILSFFDPKPIVEKSGFVFIGAVAAEKLKTQNIVIESIKGCGSTLYNKYTYIVMGPVCYGIDRQTITDAVNSYIEKEKKPSKLVLQYLEETLKMRNSFFKFDIGDLEVAASRESLSLTDNTRAVLGERIYNLIDAKVHYDQEKVQNFPSIFEAYKYLFNNVSDSPLFLGLFDYHGVKLNDYCNKVVLRKHNFTLFKHRTNGYDQVNKIRDMSIHDLLSNAKSKIFVVYSTNEKISGFNKFCVNLYKSKDRSRVLFVPNTSYTAIKKYFDALDIEPVEYIDFTEAKRLEAEEKKKERKKNRPVSSKNVGEKLDDVEVKSKYCQLFHKRDLVSHFGSTIFNLTEHPNTFYLDDKDYENFIVGLAIDVVDDVKMNYSTINKLSAYVLNSDESIYVVKQNHFTERKLNEAGIEHLSEFIKSNATAILDSYAKTKESWKFINVPSTYIDSTEFNFGIKLALKFEACMDMLLNAVWLADPSFKKSQISDLSSLNEGSFVFGNYVVQDITDAHLDMLVEYSDGEYTNQDVKDIIHEVRTDYFEKYAKDLRTRFPMLEIASNYQILNKIDVVNQYIDLTLRDEKK